MIFDLWKAIGSTLRETANRVSRHSRRGRHIMTALVAIAVVLGFCVVILYAYNKGRRAAETRVPPVIQAQEGPVKVRPESPGGMKVPNRDKEVFTRLEADKQPERVERLLPPPEKPMTSPAASGIAPKQAMNIEQAAGTTAAPKCLPCRGHRRRRCQKMNPKTPGPPPPTPPVRKPVAKKLPAKTPSAASKPSAGGRYRVQIASLPSETAIRKSWASLRGKHKDLLGNPSADSGTQGAECRTRDILPDAGGSFVIKEPSGDPVHTAETAETELSRCPALIPHRRRSSLAAPDYR